jgi:arylsulfatase A-like enzyme
MNVMVICVDTLRWDALGCYGSDWVQTPCIDAFAEQATRFENAFCASFPTVPMRVDAYTGDVNWPRYGWKGPDPEQPKLPLLLREADYNTGLVLDTKNNVGAGLHELYDEYYLIEKDVDDGVTPEMVDLPVPREHLRQGGCGYQHDVAATSHYEYEVDWFVARTMLRACDHLEDVAAFDRFFLWVDTFEPHERWHPPDHYIKLYSEHCEGLDYSYPNYGYTDIYEAEDLARLRARYAGEVTLTDRWVGHLLRQVELMGLGRDTCVILLSDHGMYIGEHGRCGKHTVDPEDPWPIYDTVGRIPLLVRTPFENAPRTVSALAQPADILPTVYELCGVEPPKTVGRSWVPLLKGEAEDLHEAVFTTFYSGGGPGFIEYHPSLITVTTPQHTAIFGPKPHEPELYDRAADPEQERNIAAEHPAVVAELRERLVRFMEAQGAEEHYIRGYAKGE